MKPIYCPRVFVLSLCLLTGAAFSAFGQSAIQIKPGRDPKVAVDEDYTKKISEYTTEAFFNSPLTNYLPASSKVPTPKAVLGDVAGRRAFCHIQRKSIATCECSNHPARASKYIQSAGPRRGAR